MAYYLDMEIDCSPRRMRRLRRATPSASGCHCLVVTAMFRRIVNIINFQALESNCERHVIQLVPSPTWPRGRTAENSVKSTGALGYLTCTPTAPHGSPRQLDFKVRNAVRSCAYSSMFQDVDIVRSVSRWYTTVRESLA